MSKGKITDVSAVDQFLIRAKSLVGNPPTWRVSSRGDYEAIWIIADDIGVESAQFRFKWPKHRKVDPAVSVIFRGNAIWRVDLAPDDECKFNPHDAHNYGLPPRVCGPHEHSWADNRDYVIENGFGRIPYRRAIQTQIRRFGQILPWLSDRINLTVTQNQRSFDNPAQDDLFGLNGHGL